MNALHDWFLDQAVGKVRALALIAFVAMIGTGVITYVTGNELAMPWVGAICGIVLYGAIYTWFQRGASDEFFDRVNMKGRMELVRRRGFVIVFGLVWSSVLLYVSQLLPEFTRIIFGTLQVVVVAGLINLFRATEEELEYAEQVRLQIEADAKAAEEAQVSVASADYDPEVFPTQGVIAEPESSTQFPKQGTIPPQQ